MALERCKECGNDVSTKAMSCPSCGAKAPKKTSKLAWLVLVLIIAGIYSASQDSDTSTGNTASTQHSRSTNSVPNTQEIQKSNGSDFSSPSTGSWHSVSKSQMSKIGGLPISATLAKDVTGNAILFVFCGEGVMLTVPNRNNEEIKSIVVDGRVLEIGQRLASMTTVSGVVGSFKRGNSVRIHGSLGSIFDFSLIGFTKARDQSC